MNFQVDHEKKKLAEAEKDKLDSFIDDVEKRDAVVGSEEKEELLLEVLIQNLKEKETNKDIQ